MDIGMAAALDAEPTDECLHGLAPETCSLCLHPAPPERRPTSPRSADRGATAPSSSFERWSSRRAERAAAGELPPDHDPTDPRSCWNAYNNYGHIDSLEVGLEYLLAKGTSTASAALWVALRLDGLGKPADWGL